MIALRLALDYTFYTHSKLAGDLALAEEIALSYKKVSAHPLVLTLGYVF